MQDEPETDSSCKKVSVVHNGFMNIDMKHLPLGGISQIEEFLKSNEKLEIEIDSVKDKYEFIKIVLLKTKYKKLTKKEKISVIKYLKFFAKYSKSRLKKLIKKWRKRLLPKKSLARTSAWPRASRAETLSCRSLRRVAPLNQSGKKRKV